VIDQLTAATSRVLLEADLRPIQGDRFQPTGFPDLGAATYTLPDGTEKLLVESTQSMANRLEAVCWDVTRDDLAAPLAGLPYVKIDLGPFGTTSTILEFHRLNSPYLWELEGDEALQAWRENVYRELGVAGRRARRGERTAGESREVPGVVDVRRLARVALKYDPNSIVHGVFLEKIAGRYRLPRILSSFIEATNVRPAESGGVKFDHVFPEADRNRGITADDGFTNVPFPRTEFVAETITAYFNIDCALLRSYGLGPEAERLVLALSLWKIGRFLDGGLRLRTACDFECTGVRVTRPADAALPSVVELDALVSDAIEGAKPAFASPPITTVRVTVPERGAQPARGEPSSSPEDGGADED
jgi:CRISPR-associated protein Csb1